MIPDYIRGQLHATPPDDCCVPPGAIPAVVEGHLEEARVATIGLNPHGPWFRRDYSPLGQDALDDAGVQRVWDEKRQYFESHYYPRYFGPLEKVLNAIGSSYGGLCGSDYPPSAVSLDLAQWVTDPQWSGLGQSVRDALLADGAPFVERILQENPHIELLLGNGKTVVEQSERAFKVHFDQWAETGLGTRLYCGEVLGRQFIGWSAFLSNTPMNRSQRAQLATRVAELAAAWGIRP